jgi:aspartate kinase
MQVVKIGGSILKNKEDFNLIKQKLMDCHNCIIVTSALKNVTNMLIESYETKNTGIIDNIYHMHTGIIQLDSNIISTLAGLRDELKKLVVQENSPSLRDHIISYGERMSTLLLYNFFKNNGFNSSYIIEPLLVTDDNYGDSSCIIDKTAIKINNCVFGDLTIVPGFYGATIDGNITTVGRGGSDYTAMVFASVLNCDVRIITDVPGIMTSDPKLFKNSRTLREVSLSEVLKMSYYGVKNFNYKTFTPVLGTDVNITVESLYEDSVTRITKKPVNSIKCVAMTNYGRKDRKNMLVFIGHGFSDPAISMDIISKIGKEQLYHMDSLSLSILVDEDIIKHRNYFEEAPLWIK